MQCNFAWGDHVSLFSIAHVLRRPIVVFKDLPGVPPLLLAPLEGDWGLPLYVHLNDADPGAEHYSPLLATRKRLLTKQRDAWASVHDSAGPPPPQPALAAAAVQTRCLRLPQQRRPLSDGHELCRRRFAHAKKRPATRKPAASEATLTKTLGDSFESLAPLAQGLLAQGLSQKAIQGSLGIGKDKVRELLHMRVEVPDYRALRRGVEARQLKISQSLLKTYLTSCLKAWHSHAGTFGVFKQPPIRDLPLPTETDALDLVWARLGSWQLCCSCGLRLPLLRLTHQWLKVPYVSFCDTCKLNNKWPHLKSLTPSITAWGSWLRTLAEDDWLSLALLKFKVDYKVKRGGKSPVWSRQKLSVTKAVWCDTLPAAENLSPVATAALRVLLETNTHYRHFYGRLQRLLRRNGKRSLGTAEFLLRMPGIEVAARPWLYPKDR